MHYPHPLEIADRRKRVACIIAAVLLVVAGIVYTIWPTGPYGPSYQGRSLISWLGDYTNPTRYLQRLRRVGSINLTHAYEDSNNAINAIGTNAIPTLLQLMQARDSWPRAICMNMIDGPRSQQEYFISARHKRNLASMGFLILSTNALPAAPELLKLTASRDADVRRRAFSALFLIELPNRKPLLPVVVQFSRDPDEICREMAGQYIRHLMPLMSADEAKAAGVYEAFPELVSSPADALHKP